MKITLEPTPTVRKVDGVDHREWKGVDEEGVAIVALVRSVQPQTHDEAVAARYRATLKDIGFAREAPIELRHIL